MKTQKSILAIVLVTILVMAMSCEQEKVDPALVLDEVLLPSGYHQNDAPPEDALARLTELRLDNPNDHFYYLELEDKSLCNSRKWVFPQKELKIEYVASEETKTIGESPNVQGLIVKKIRGNWQDEEFTVFDTQPQPKNGLKIFYEYINANLKYPEQARREGVQGKVFVEFIVDKDGKLIDVKAVKGIGAGCDEEAVRVIREAQAWEPAKVVDMPVRIKMILPITYNLN